LEDRQARSSDIERRVDVDELEAAGGSISRRSGPFLSEAMKRLMLASVTLLALTRMDAALAADVPPAVIYPAGTSPGVIYPTAAPPFTFTGFHVGGTVGGALGSSNYSEAPSGTAGSVVVCPKSNPLGVVVHGVVVVPILVRCSGGVDRTCRSKGWG
jgi:hypothetical protein